MLNRKKLVNALKEFLEKDKWDTWLTVTFRTPVTSSLAKKKFKYFFKTLNKPDEEFFKKYILSCVFVERNKVKKGFHIHALVKGVAPSLCSRLEEKCREYFGESRVMPVHEGVIPYLCDKYDTSSLEDWRFFKINSRLRASKPTAESI